MTGFPNVRMPSTRRKEPRRREPARLLVFVPLRDGGPLARCFDHRPLKPLGSPMRVGSGSGCHAGWLGARPEPPQERVRRPTPDFAFCIIDRMAQVLKAPRQFQAAPRYWRRPQCRIRGRIPGCPGKAPAPAPGSLRLDRSRRNRGPAETAFQRRRWTQHKSC